MYAATTQPTNATRPGLQSGVLPPTRDRESLGVTSQASNPSGRRNHLAHTFWRFVRGCFLALPGGLVHALHLVRAEAFGRAPMHSMRGTWAVLVFALGASLNG